MGPSVKHVSGVLEWSYVQGETGRVFQLRVGSGSGIEKIFRVGSGRVGYRVFVSNTKSIGYYGVLKS